MKIVKKIMIGIVFVLVIIAVVELPSIYCNWLDSQNNKKIYTESISQIDLNFDVKLTTVEKMKLISNSADLRTLMEDKSLSDIKKDINMEWIHTELSIMNVCNLAPDLSKAPLEDTILSAKSVVVFDDKSNQSLSIYVIHCSDKKTFDYTFCFDADSHIIYAARLYDKNTKDYCNKYTRKYMLTKHAPIGLVNYYEIDDIDIDNYYHVNGGWAFSDYVYKYTNTKPVFDFRTIKPTKKTFVPYDGLSVGNIATWSLINREKTENDTTMMQ